MYFSLQIGGQWSSLRINKIWWDIAPLLEWEFPEKALHQAIVVVEMHLQEENTTISPSKDVSAWQFMAISESELCKSLWKFHSYPWGSTSSWKSNRDEVWWQCRQRDPTVHLTKRCYLVLPMIVVSIIMDASSARCVGIEGSETENVDMLLGV